MSTIRRKLKRAFLRIVSAKGEPRQIAGGMAVGLFWGMSPLWGIQAVLAVITATIFNVSRIPAALAVHVSNPLTLIIYLYTWRVGNFVLTPFMGPGRELSLNRFLDSFHYGQLWHFAGDATDIMLRMIIGGIIVGFPVAAVGYVFTLIFVTQFRKRLQIRRKVRRARRISAYLRRQESAASGPAPEHTREYSETADPKSRD